MFLLSFFLLTLSFLAWCFLPILFSSSDSYLRSSSRILDADGQMLLVFPVEGRTYQFFLPLEEIDEDFLRLLLAKEDANYYEHWGVDAPKKAYLLWGYLSGDSTRGGSTITEQWIKTKYFPSSSRSMLQKLREATVASTFSLGISKEQILEEYLNTVYFGRGAYGVEAAAQVYFAKHFSDLHLMEKAFLVSLISRPSDAEYLAANFDNYRDYYLDIALENILISPDQRDGYADWTPTLTARKKSEDPYLRSFTQLLLQQLGGEGVYLADGDYRIRSTVYPAWQKQAEDIVFEELYRLREQKVQDASVVILDARDGGVRVLLGTTRPEGYEMGNINTAINPRPIASTIKPFLFLFAFLEGAHPRQLIADEEQEYLLPDETKYIPLNFNGKAYGDIALEEALANSLNLSAVHLLDMLGVESFASFLETLELHLSESPDFYGLSLALGTAEWSPLQLAETATIFVHDGEKISASFIEHVQRNDEQFTFSPQKTQLLSSYSEERREAALFWVRRALADRSLRQKVFGYQSTLSWDHQFSVKTGTSMNFKDNWALAFSEEYIVVVWTGNLDKSPMEEVSGIDGAGIILSRLLEELPLIAEEHSPPAFLLPTSVCAGNFQASLQTCAEQEQTHFFPEEQSNLPLFF